jgi:hypothetical protein
MSDYRDWTHVYDHHRGQLPRDFRLGEGVTWAQVHMLLHRLFKWKDWHHD